MELLPFFIAANLTIHEQAEGYPWNFQVPESRNWLKRLPKSKRRAALLIPDASWNVYSAVRGVNPTRMISDENPAAGLRGLVVDYDMVNDISVIDSYLSQIPEKLQPNFIEVSLGNKTRLVWVFEREILTPSTAFCRAVLEQFVSQMGLAGLLAGYDPIGTLKPTERWSNGGTWYNYRSEPLAWSYCFGVICDVSKKSNLFGRAEIPLEEIAEEVQSRWPNRWLGEFKLDTTGVRFWDDHADNPTGCQVKPDGMLCFTGPVPFVKWDKLLGKAWCDERRALSLGNAGENLYFDGNLYWEKTQHHWQSLKRQDVVLRLKGRGLSDKCGKGETQSDAERVLDYMQQMNRVEGAAPFINYKPGLMEMNGLRFLNVANLNPVVAKPGPCKDPFRDFKFLAELLNGLFARAELGPLDHFLTWLKFSHESVIRFERRVGQAIFLCGPRNNGKTLLCDHVVAPMLGRRTADPMDYMTGQTSFNDELFHASLLAINDRDAPRNEGERAKMLMRLKSFVVNPTHTYHPKFCSRVTIQWTGRIFITLNDDPGSVGVLPEVSYNTADKMMFFASQPYRGQWPSQSITESMIAEQLPYFAHWLVNEYEPPESVLSTEIRGGVKSYYDPVILELSRQQLYAFNLEELLRAWFRVAPHWAEDTQVTWVGTPTDLLTDISSYDPLKTVAREWTQSKVARAMTALAKQPNSGVEFSGETGREFKITRTQL